MGTSEPGENTLDPNVGPNYPLWLRLRKHVGSLVAFTDTLNTVTAIPPGDASYVATQKGPYSHVGYEQIGALADETGRIAGLISATATEAARTAAT
jgi:hypothetical protein